MKYSKVTVGRKWANRTVYVEVKADKVGIESAMTLQDFLSALVQQAGNPSLLLTKAALEKRLSAAATELTEKMKGETVQVL